MNGTASAIKAIVLAALAVGIWALAEFGHAIPAPVPATAPATQFSALRAKAVLTRILGPEVPHPASSLANAAVRARIIAEFENLGITPMPVTAMGCNREGRAAMLACATVTDLVVPILPGQGKAIVLMAHYDSVPAGPGAADDASSVATIIETARALRTGPRVPHLHPVIAVLTDGEEYGLLGAAAFLDKPALKAQVGVVVNAEARGNQGPSLLFQTSAGNKALIDLYAEHVRDYATSSIYDTIYKYLPNDTDLTLFLRDGFAGMNFAFIGNVADYHTPLDTIRNLSLATLQSHGDNVLGVVRGLERTPYANLKGPNAIDLDILGRLLPRLPATWALPIAVVELLLLIAALVLSPGDRRRPEGWIGGILIFPALVIGASVIGGIAFLIAELISNTPQPGYAHPQALRIALALGAAAATLAVSRFARVRAAAACVWLWLAAIGVAIAVFLPGLSPYFLLPGAFAAVLLLVTARSGWSGALGQGALLVSALAALLVWLQLAADAEKVMGIAAFPLFTIPASLGAVALVPLLVDDGQSVRGWLAGAGLCLAGAIIAAVVAGLQPAYSRAAPQRLNLAYVENVMTSRALWTASTNAPLPPALRKAAAFSARPEAVAAGLLRRAYVAPAGKPRLPPPAAAILTNARVGTTRRVTLGLDGSPQAAMMSIVLPGAAGLTQIVLGQKAIAVPQSWARHRRIVITCMSYNCASLPVTLDMTDRGPLRISLIERRMGLPAFGNGLAAARPDTAVASQFGDATLLLSQLNLPGT